MIYGYARVSTEDQRLDVQLDQLKAAGCRVIYREKASGAKDDRPELSRMLGEVKPGDTVVVCKLDRMARSTQHLLNIVDRLEKGGVSFRVLNINLDTSTPTGKLMLTMLGAIATFEREMMLERQREGIAKAKARGVYKGRQPMTEEKRAKVLRLIRSGKTRQETADLSGVGIASVYRILKAQG